MEGEENLINKKHLNEPEQKDNLVLMKQMFLKNTEKESFILENIRKRFADFKNNQKKSFISEHEDNNSLLQDDSDSQDFKVCSTQIKYLNDVADYRNRKFVENITKDINMLTKVQSQKLETIDDNIVTVKDNAQASYRTVLKTSNEDKKFKENKCWIMLLISFALFFMLLIFLNIQNNPN